MFKPLLCLMAAVVCLTTAEDINPVDRLRNMMIKAMDSLRREIVRPEWAASAKSQDLSLEQHFIKSFPSFAPDIFYEELPQRELSSIWLWSRLREKARVVRSLYSILVKSLPEYKDPELFRSEWEGIAKNSYKTVNETFDFIFRAVYDGRIYRQILKEHNENLCNIQESPSQLLFNVYNSLQMTQLKAYALMQFSWMYRKLENESSNYEEEAGILHEVYLDHLEKQAEIAKEAMSLASKELKRCDPKEHVPEETYTTLSRFLQGFLVNEVDLNDKNTCREDCSYYQYTKQHGCFKDQYCSKQRRCQGNVVNCKFVDSDMWVCPAGIGQSRRYNYIKYENGKVLGNQDLSCRQAVSKVDSWWRWLFWHCSYCMCICDESNSVLSDRYFSLRPTLADTKKNRILVGLRLIKKNQVIHIQGQEAELLPDGHIKQSTLSWIPVHSIDTHSSNYKESIDYHKMSWEQRAIDLDDLIGPKGYLLTGVKWRKLGSHLNLEIKVCQFDYTKGELVEGGNKCHWISNDNTDASIGNPRKQIVLHEPDLPTKVRHPSREFSPSDSFIEFTHSDLTEDVAQEAVPFIDTQTAIPVPPVPLSGAGIYHKGLYKTGGFIAPKVFTIDFEGFVKGPGSILVEE